MDTLVCDYIDIISINNNHTKIFSVNVYIKSSCSV